METEALFDNWLQSEGVHWDFDLFREMVSKDKIISSILAKMAVFLKEQQMKSLKDLEEKRTAYFNVSKEVFTMSPQPELEIGAASCWSKEKENQFSNTQAE